MFDNGPQVPAGGEAAAGPGVAGGADLVDLDQKGVAVAIQGHGLNVLVVSGGVALAPVLPTGARP